MPKLTHNEQHLAVKRLRRELLAEVKRLLRPHLHDSGYNKHLEKGKGIFGKKRPLKVWVPGDGRYLKVRTIGINQIEGFTEDGVITDSHGGGLVTDYWHGVCIEDLLAIRVWATKHFVEPS